MSRLMLDTSAYSAFMRGHAEIKLALQRVEEICVNPIILTTDAHYRKVAQVLVDYVEPS